MTPGGVGPAPFVVGVNRSGTTLLRLMLDSHPELAIPPETHFLPELIDEFGGRGEPAAMARLIASGREWGDFGFTESELAAAMRDAGAGDAAGAARAFYGLYAERAGKRRWGDKTPAYGRSMTAIASVLPEARFVHVIRDGRDVLLSIRDRAERPRPAARVAERWRGRIVGAREQARELPHYLEVRYEDLVADAEAELRRICELAELRCDPAMLSHHERAGGRLAEMDRPLPAHGDLPPLGAERRRKTHARALGPPDPSRASRWREELEPGDRREFEAVAGDVLAELGYEVG